MENQTVKAHSELYLFKPIFFSLSINLHGFSHVLFCYILPLEAVLKRKQCEYYYMRYPEVISLLKRI